MIIFILQRRKWGNWDVERVSDRFRFTQLIGEAQELEVGVKTVDLAFITPKLRSSQVCTYGRAHLCLDMNVHMGPVNSDHLWGCMGNKGFLSISQSMELLIFLHWKHTPEICVLMHNMYNIWFSTLKPQQQKFKGCLWKQSSCSINLKD